MKLKKTLKTVLLLAFILLNCNLFAQINVGIGQDLWKITGNTANEQHFIGTINQQALKFRTNNIERLLITSDGKIGIGVSNPLFQLDVAGNVSFRNNFKLPGLLPEEINLGKDILIIDELGNIARGGIDGLIDIIHVPSRACRTDVNGDIPRPTWANGLNKIYTECDPVKVGVGTNAPLYKLDVRGVNYASSLYLGKFTGETGDANLHLKSIYPITIDRKLVHVQNGTTSLFVVKNNGNIGINIENPTVKLDVLGDAKIDGTVFSKKSVIEVNLAQNVGAILFEIKNADRPVFQINNNGLMRSRRILVDLDTEWPDYVFKKNYNLMPLKEVETFITENKHLPNVPSANTIKKEGIDVAEMNRILMQKIEELTLYMIQMEKEIESLKNKP